MGLRSAPIEHEQEIQLRLRWRHTWPDRPNDFVAEAPGYSGSVGRIYLIEENHGPHGGKWFWAFQALGPEISRNIGNVKGYEPSPRQAAKCVEDAWFAAIKGSSLENLQTPSAPKSAYAAAKGRE